MKLVELLRLRLGEGALAQELGYDKGWQLEQVDKFNAVAQGFVVKVVKTADGKGVIPQVIATYPADKITPACNKTDYSD